MRNLLGVLIVFACFANAYEALVPDVHDGDAATVAVQQQAARAGAADVTPNQQRPECPAVPDVPHHAQHADHCAHSHVASLTCGVALGEPPVSEPSVPASAESALRGIAHAPGLRPPII